MKRVYFLQFLYIAAFCWLLCGCGTLKKSRVETREKEEREHTRLITYKDTAFVTPRREVSLGFPLRGLKIPLNDCPKQVLAEENKRDKPMVYTQRNGHAQVRVRIQHDTLKVTAICDTLKIKAQMKRILEKEWRSREHTQAEKNERRRGVGWLLVMLYVFISFILGGAVQKIFSLF